MDWSGYLCGCKSSHVQCKTCYTPARDGVRKRVTVVIRGSNGTVCTDDRVIVDRVIDSRWSLDRIMAHWVRKYPDCDIAVERVKPAGGGTRTGNLLTGEGRIG
jgi:hypothetical protein